MPRKQRSAQPPIVSRGFLALVTLMERPPSFARDFAFAQTLMFLIDETGNRDVGGLLMTANLFKRFKDAGVDAGELVPDLDKFVQELVDACQKTIDRMEREAEERAPFAQLIEQQRVLLLSAKDLMKRENNPDEVPTTGDPELDDVFEIANSSDFDVESHVSDT